MFEIILVGFVYLGGNLERYAAMLGNADGEIDALFTASSRADVTESPLA